MKRYLITGMLIWVPILITVVVVRAFLDFSDYALLLIPEAYRPTEIYGVHIPGLGVLFVLLVLFFTGLLFRNMFGHFIVEMWEHLVTKIPLVSSIHNGVKQTLKVVFTTNKSFQEVVLIEYPRRDCWSVAFVTNRQAAHGDFKHDILTLFVPTTPNPTSGYVFVVDEQEVKYLDMSVDEAVKFIISLGTVDDIGHKIKAKKQLRT
ncbi:MAG: hypothetical protein CMF52_06230 [Legionellales bacterium]|nr:hypothetical protein [Legionellales bacterium]HAV93378.1 hypothetical protein [Pseudomonadota bacterium]